MPTQLLSIGYPQSMLQNVAYAVPARRVFISTSTAAAAIQGSNDPTFGDNQAITLTNGEAEIAFSFIRATNAGPTVVSLRAMA